MHRPRLVRLLAIASSLTALVLCFGVRHSSAASPARPVAKNGSYTNTGTKLTVTIVKHATDTKGSEFEHPKKGSEYEYIYVTIKNGGSKAQEYNELDFSLIDNKGQTWNPGFVSSDRYAPELNSSQVPGHQTRAGWIGFEIPRSTTSMRIDWTKPNTLDDQVQIGMYRLP